MTSRSMAFTAASSARHARESGHPASATAVSVGWAKSHITAVAAWARRVRDFAHAERFEPRAFAHPTALHSFHRIRLLQLREVALLLELVDDAEIEIVVHVAAADVGPDRLELLEHALGTLDRGRRVAWHQALEIGIGRRDDFRIAGLEFLRDDLLRLLLVREREVGAGDVGLHEAREGGAVLLEVAAGDHDRVENPRRVGRCEIDDRVEAA